DGSGSLVVCSSVNVVFPPTEVRLVCFRSPAADFSTITENKQSLNVPKLPLSISVIWSRGVILGMAQPEKGLREIYLAIFRIGDFGRDGEPIQSNAVFEPGRIRKAVLELCVCLGTLLF